jgi:hypothetical protein
LKPLYHITAHYQIYGYQKIMKKIFIAVLCAIAIVIVSLLAVPLLLGPGRSEALQNAITRAIDFSEEIRDPYALLMLDVMYHRFGITAFADSLQLYDQELSERPDEAPLLRVFRRIADHDNQLQPGDLDAVSIDIDQITVPALYCDRLGFSDSYADILEQATILGGNLLPHIVLARIWTEDNGCEWPRSESSMEMVYKETEDLIGDNPLVDDLKLEAAAFLYLAGQGSQVDDNFINRVLAVQNDDGGWSYSSDKSSESVPHATVLALMLLLHVQNPADSYPPMLAPASQ